MTEILRILNDKILKEESAMQEWCQAKFAKTPPLFYTSVDIRHSGVKLAPVDTNVFPGGFNNLTEQEREDASEAAKAYLAQYYPSVAKILVIAEDHTRNLYYLENVAVITQMLTEVGMEVMMGSFQTSELGEPVELESVSGQILHSQPLVKKDGKLQTKSGFVPDLIVVNNDLTGGAPEMLNDIAQPVVPPPGFGWYQRRKTSHFDSYNDIARSFCREFDIDPWLITTVFHKCGVLNFKEQKGVDCVAIGVDKVIHAVKKKYDEYGIKEAPYAFIKSNRGTYGMGIMTACSGEDVIQMNKKIRNKMAAIKGGESNTEVIIQEGIPTIDAVDGNPAEPMIYLVAGQPVGYIYRLNTKRDEFGNLNASGMQFSNARKQQCMEECHMRPLGLIAQLASHAAAWECYAESYQI